MVVTISPNLSLYKMVVLPAASNPTIRILISFLPKKLLNNEAMLPILVRFETFSQIQRSKLVKAGYFFTPKNPLSGPLPVCSTKVPKDG